MDSEESKRLDEIDKKLSKLLKVVKDLKRDIQNVDCSGQLYMLEETIKEMR